MTVSFKIPREHPDVNVPAEALIFNQRGLQVATVENDQVAMHNVTIYRDYGTTVDLREGLQGGERAVLSPPATLADNAKVKETREEEEKQNEEQKRPDPPGKQVDAAPAAKANELADRAKPFCRGQAVNIRQPPDLAHSAGAVGRNAGISRPQE